MVLPAAWSHRRLWSWRIQLPVRHGRSA